jgi:hypothetical protein
MLGLTGRDGATGNNIRLWFLGGGMSNNAKWGRTDASVLPQNSVGLTSISFLPVLPDAIGPQPIFPE